MSSVHLGQGCGDVLFGMAPDQVHPVLGKPTKTFDRGGGTTNDSFHQFGQQPSKPILDATYVDNRLNALSLYGPCLTLLEVAGQNVLTLPLMSAIEVLQEANGTLERTQGGALVFENLRLRIIDPADPLSRSIEIWNNPPHALVLGTTSVEQFLDYYIDPREGPPTHDTLLNGGD